MENKIEFHDNGISCADERVKKIWIFGGIDMEARKEINCISLIVRGEEETHTFTGDNGTKDEAALLANEFLNKL